MTDWQPINEDTPRDGTPLLGLNCVSGLIAMMRYSKPEWCEIDRYGRYMEIGFYPTHYLPLPPLPEPPVDNSVDKPVFRDFAD